MAELSELLGMLERDLVSVDGGRDPTEVVAQTFRVFHTVKGTASFLGFDKLRELSHAAEDLLDAIRDGTVSWSHSVTDILLEVQDAMRAIMDAIARTKSDGKDNHAPLITRFRAAETGTQANAPAERSPAAKAPEGKESLPPAPPEAAPPAGPPPKPLFQPLRPAPRLVRRNGPAQENPRRPPRGPSRPTSSRPPTSARSASRWPCSTGS
jgi:two-component system chemotaxis sensor kinase CheA